MATAAENLQVAYDNVCARLAEITADQKPSYTQGDRTVSWTEYYTALITQAAMLREQIIAAAGTFEVRTQGRG